MAAFGSKMFGCPVCGFRVAHDESACQRCGNKFTINTRFECPFCGDLIDSSQGSCPSCHVNFGDFREKTHGKGSDESIDNLLLEIIHLEASQVKEEDKRLSCPSCSWLLDGTETSCPKCSADLTEDVSFQCPVCGATVDAEAARCPDCDACFVEDVPPQGPAVPDTMKELEIFAAASEEKEKTLEPPMESKKPKQRKLKAKPKQSTMKKT